MSYDLSTLPVPVARLVQEALIQRGLYEGTTAGRPAGKTQRAFADYLLDEYPERAAVPKWLLAAREWIGLREIPGVTHHPTIVRWWQAIGSWFRDDETPWCAAFVGGVLEACGIRSTGSAAARSYLDWGKPLPGPVTGAVVIYWRGARSGWQGHVGFVEGVDTRGNILTLGGNQSDAVNVKAFAPDRVLGYRWPLEEHAPVADAVAVLSGEFEETGGNEV